MHSPVKDNESPGDEGKQPAPRKQKTDCNRFIPHEGQAYRGQTAPKPNQNKATPAENRTPIFGEIGNGFTYTASTKEQQKLYGAWRQRNSTPGKAADAVQSMLDENTEPPSLGEPYQAFLDSLTPPSMDSATISQELLLQNSNRSDDASIHVISQSSSISPSEHIKSPAATSQDMLSQNSNDSDATAVEPTWQISDAASVELVSQRSNTSPSKHTNPERALNFEPTPERRSARTSKAPLVFDVAQVQQDKNARKKPEAIKCYSPYPIGDL